MTDIPAAGERLDTGLRNMGIPLSGPQRDALLQYLALLLRWNGSYNLTAVRDPLAMVDRHLLDSLALLRFIRESGARLVDVGTGAGLPGAPLAIMQPGNAFDLLDSNGKKTRFLFQVKTALGLDNMAVRHARAEAWAPDAPYQVVLSRAFASLADMFACCAHLCDGETRILAMKGRVPQEELDALPASARLVAITPLAVPGLDEERHLVELALSV